MAFKISARRQSGASRTSSRQDGTRGFSPARSSQPPPSRTSTAPRTPIRRVQILPPEATETLLNGDRDSSSRRGDEEEIDPDIDALNEVVMAVDLEEKGTVGCAYYVAREERLYFMEDAKLGGVDMVDACM